MKNNKLALILGAFLLTVFGGVLSAAQTKNSNIQKNSHVQKQPKTDASEYRLSGPYTHKNLSIFLIHSKTTTRTKSFLTLQEALEQKKVVVYETQSVNELAIENLSNEDVFVQSGDIVKGGQQDRMMAVDLIVPPRSGKMPIAAFCVEHGRWSGRGNERVTVFGSSSDVASTKEIKLAAKRSNSQGGVWQSVTVAQDKLSQNVGGRVNSSVSESSLQLAVENHKVQETADSYIKALSGIVNSADDVIGYVFAINGNVNSADVYASNVLFRKLWPKLLKANAVEAIAELQKDKFKPASAESVKTFLSESEKARASEKDVTARVGLVTREDDKNIFFETRDRAQKDAWIHRNYIKKN
jgi:ARG/rhodanese/phosphatase superfamily protein